MAKPIESIVLSLKATFAPDYRLTKIDIDRFYTEVNFSDGTTTNIKRRIYRNSRVHMRFVWLLIAFKIRQKQPNYGSPLKLVGLLADNLDALNRPEETEDDDSERGNKQLRDLFPAERVFDEFTREEREVCGLVCYFYGPFRKGEFVLRIRDDERLEDTLTPKKIIVCFCDSVENEPRPAKDLELNAILRDYDPISLRVREEQEQSPLLPATVAAAVLHEHTVNLRSEVRHDGSIKVAIPSPSSGATDPADESEAVHEGVAEAIDELLADNEPIRKILRGVCMDAFTPIGRDRVIVAQPFRQGSGNSCAVLAAIRSNLSKTADFKAPNCDDLLKIVGAFVSFAVDPKWIKQQRLKTAIGHIECPGRLRFVNVTEPQRTADMIPVLLAALAQGIPQLARIFSKSPIDPLEKIVPPKGSFGSVLRDEQLRDLKTHLIYEFLSSDSLPEDSKDLSDEEEIRGYMTEVQGMLKRAFELDRTPYFTLNDVYLSLVEALVSPEINAKWFLAVSMGNRATSSLIVEPNNSFDLFSDAFAIYENVRRRFPSY